MTTILTKETYFQPAFSTEKLATWGLSAVTTATSFMAAHVALKAMNKQNSMLVTGSVAVAGLAGAIFLPHPALKFLALGVATYGMIQTASLAVADATTPGATSGLAGIIPETIKAKIRAFIPTLSGAVTLLGDDDLQGMPNLDDVAGVEDVGYVDVSEQKSIGSML
jgi:hypothetical protein